MVDGIQQYSGQRNFHAVWPSLFATSMGLMAVLPMLPLYIEERFGIEDENLLTFWAALIYGVAPLAAAIAGPVWGALGDRIGRKPMAIRANLAIALTMALMPLAPSPVWLLVMRIVQGAFAGYVAPSIALASHGVPPELHGRVIARLQVAMAAGMFVGPFLGAEMAYWWGRGSIFYITSLFTVLAALQLAVMARDSKPTVPAGTSFVSGMIESTKALLSNRVFAWLLVFLVVLRLGQNMLEPFVALLVRDLGAAPWIEPFSATPSLAIDRTIGVAFGTLALAQFVFTPIWGRLADRFGPLRCLYFLALMLAGILAATSMVTTIDGFLGMRALAAMTMAGSMTLAFSAVSKRVAEHRRALAFSMVQSCAQLGFALGPQLGAYFAIVGSATDGVVDYRRPFLFAGVLCLAAAVGMFVLRRVRSRSVEYGLR